MRGMRDPRAMRDPRFDSGVESTQANAKAKSNSRTHTTAHELIWLRKMYKEGKFQALLNLREVYKTREWGEGTGGMMVDKYKIVDALDGMCQMIEKIMGVHGSKTIVLTPKMRVVIHRQQPDTRQHPDVLPSEGVD